MDDFLDVILHAALAAFHGLTVVNVVAVDLTVEVVVVVGGMICVDGTNTAEGNGSLVVGLLLVEGGHGHVAHLGEHEACHGVRVFRGELLLVDHLEDLGEDIVVEGAHVVFVGDTVRVDAAVVRCGVVSEGGVDVGLLEERVQGGVEFLVGALVTGDDSVQKIDFLIFGEGVVFLKRYTLIPYLL